jgi:hypothetical protein
MCQGFVPRLQLPRYDVYIRDYYVTIKTSPRLSHHDKNIDCLPIV